MIQLHLLVLLAVQLLPFAYAGVTPQAPLFSHEISQEHFDESYDVDLAETRILQLSDDAEPVSRTLLRAMHTYGIVCADNRYGIEEGAFASVYQGQTCSIGIATRCN
jgi:hypothetical protein